MSDSAHGGNDILKGGNNSGGSSVENDLFGDAITISGSARGGNDILIAGTASAGSTVANFMWGDAAVMSGTASGGQDTFVFRDSPARRFCSDDRDHLNIATGQTVGTSNFVEDFSCRRSRCPASSKFASSSQRPSSANCRALNCGARFAMASESLGSGQ